MRSRTIIFKLLSSSALSLFRRQKWESWWWPQLWQLGNLDAMGKRENLFHFLLIFCKLISSSSISSCVVFSSSVFLIIGWNFSLNHSSDFQDIFALNLVFIIWIVWARTKYHSCCGPKTLFIPLILSLGGKFDD